MGEQLIYGENFWIEQLPLKRGFNKCSAKGRRGRGRPKGSRNKHGYKRRQV